MNFDYLEWVEFMVRWFHVIAGIAWIGSSFYFIALDLSLRNHLLYHRRHMEKLGKFMEVAFII